MKLGQNTIARSIWAILLQIYDEDDHEESILTGCCHEVFVTFAGKH